MGTWEDLTRLTRERPPRPVRRAALCQRPRYEIHGAVAVDRLSWPKSGVRTKHIRKFCVILSLTLWKITLEDAFCGHNEWVQEHNKW